MYFATGASLTSTIAALPAATKGNYKAFDDFYYAQLYMGSYTGTLTPIEHFVQIGAGRGYKPNADFDPTYYKALYTDLKSTSFDAADLLYHYVATGLNEGRIGNATLAGSSWSGYLTAYPDVATYVNANLASFGGSTTNGAVAHYAKFGQYEGRAVPGGPSSGQTFTLTTGVDSVTGTGGGDKVTAVIGTGATLNPGDAIDLGQGTDTLRISYGSDVAVSTALAAATVTGVDTVSLINPGVGNDSVNLTGLTGLKTLIIENAALLNSTTTATSIQTPVGGVNLSLATNAGVTTAGPVIWEANATDTTLNLTLNGYVGTGAATNLTTNGAAATTLNVTTATAANKAATFLAPATVTTLNIAAGTALTNTATTSVAATKVNITGAGAVTLGTTNFAATITIDASAATGNVSVTAENTTILTYKGGSGNDTVAFAVSQLTSADVIDMGSGTGDVLSIAETALGGTATAALNAVVNGINGVDVLLSTGAATIDMSGVTVTTLRLGATANQVVQKVAATDKIQVNGVTAGTLDATASLGFNTLNLEMNGAAAVAALGATNVTSQATINILSTTSATTSAGVNTIAAITNSANASFVVTGANALTVTSLSAAASFDASAATGAIIVTGADAASIFKGGNKADTLTGATLAGGDTFDGGAGDDTINSGAQTGTVATVITGGLGADAINLQGVTAVLKVVTINATAAQSFATAGQFDTVTISDGAARTANYTITLVTGLTSSTVTGTGTAVVLGTTTVTAGSFLAVGSVNATLTTTDQNFQIYQDSNSNGIIDATDLRVDFIDAATDTTAITIVGGQIVVVHAGV